MLQSKSHAFAQMLKTPDSASCRRPERKMNQTPNSASCWRYKHLPSAARFSALCASAGAQPRSRRPVPVRGPLQACTGRDIKNNVSLYPLMALALAACGGSPPPPPPFVKRIFGPDPAPTETETGRVFDGPIVGAQIYFDVNEDGVQNTGDVLIGRTDELGNFTISAQDLATYGDNTPLLAVLDGAIDIGDDLTDPGDDRTLTSGTWQAPVGSSVISPLTDFLVKAGMDNEGVVELLGLPSDVDVTQYDPYESDTLDATALVVIAAGQKVAEVLEELATTGTEVTPAEINAAIESAFGVAPPVLTVSGEPTPLGEGGIGENTPTGYTVSATDEDGNAITFSVDDARFAVVDGALVAVTGAVFDFETEPSITLTITATDNSFSRLTSAPQTVDVTVTDLVELTYDGIAPGIGRAGVVAPGGEAEETLTTAHFKVAPGETATYTADDFTVYEQNAEGVYEESTRFDITFFDASEVNSEIDDETYDTFALTLLAGNALPSSTPEPINVRVEADGAVTTYFQVVTAEDTLQEYGLDRDTLTGTVSLPGVTTLNDIIVTDARSSYSHAFERFFALGELNVELVSAATDDDDAVVSWTYELDHNGPGLNHGRIDWLMAEIFALSGGGTTQYVAVDVQTQWNRYLANAADGNPILAEADKDAANTVHGRLGGDDIVKGFGGNDVIHGYGGNDVLIGGAGDDTINLGHEDHFTEERLTELGIDGDPAEAAGSSTVIYRFDSKDDTALAADGVDKLTRAADGNDTLTGFELGVDRVILIDIDEATPIVDMAGLIALAKTDALYVKLVGSSGVLISDPSDDVWLGIDFSFYQDDAGVRDPAPTSRVNDRTLRISFHETITDAEATARFGGDATTAVGTYFQEDGNGATRGDLTDAGLDALATFFANDDDTLGSTLLVVDTDVDLDVFLPPII